MGVYPRCTIGAVVTVLATVGAVVPAVAQSNEALQRAVEEALRGDRALRGLDVAVVGSEATLAGRVRTFWEKSQALRRALDVPGVATVASEIDIPRLEHDQALADEVIKAIQRYGYYTMWDQIEFRVNDGAVTVTGRVTPDQDKEGDLFERIAKVRGVQDLHITFEVLSPSRSDRTIRDAIARQLFANDLFQQFRTTRNRPFHIIVDNGIVTLIGYVQSEIERLEMHRVVGQTAGVLRVENQLQTLSR